MKFKNDMPQEIGFQLAPMLDVVFLLLIFFIVTQTFSLTEQDLSVKVPSAQQANKTDSRLLNEIILNVRKDGAVTINREVFPLEQLSKKMMRLAQAGADKTPVLIRGDADCSYQSIINVVDECLKARIYNIRFSTKKPQAQKAPAAGAP